MSTVLLSTGLTTPASSTHLATAGASIGATMTGRRTPFAVPSISCVATLGRVAERLQESFVIAVEIFEGAFDFAEAASVVGYTKIEVKVMLLSFMQR